MRDSSVITASVIPSAKYSCSGSFERFASGRTASESIRPLPFDQRLLSLPTSAAKRSARTASAPSRLAASGNPPGRVGGGPVETTVAVPVRSRSRPAFSSAAVA
jgi:hypothetical protein